jgi:hypothetical protein
MGTVIKIPAVHTSLAYYCFSKKKEKHVDVSFVDVRIRATKEIKK